MGFAMPQYLQQLEAESIYIIREVAAQFERPVILYSVGKDSSVVVRLALKAFAPAVPPFPLLHIDTSYDYPEMYSFRDTITDQTGMRLLVYRNEEAISQDANPFSLGTQKCCGLLRTKALLDGLAKYEVDAAIGGARRDEERARAKERVFSFRDSFGQWDPRNQRPEMWKLYNGRVNKGESMRVFPLSNWTEFDIWLYILCEQIPIVPLYFAKHRPAVRRKGSIETFIEGVTRLAPGEKVEEILCRFRSLGCTPCTGAIESEAATLEAIVEEMFGFRMSERAGRIIDYDTDGSMEIKKREGYF
jgi:sulfate adenylyltransferase subunit 2